MTVPHLVPPIGLNHRLALDELANLMRSKNLDKPPKIARVKPVGCIFLLALFYVL